MLVYPEAAAIKEPQGAREEVSDTLNPAREQTRPHTGAVNKKERPFPFSDAYTARLHHPWANTTQRAEHLRQHTAEAS